MSEVPLVHWLLDLSSGRLGNVSNTDAAVLQHVAHTLLVNDAEIERLQTELAAVDALVAAHAYTIDPTPPQDWPKSSNLRKAIDRHCARKALEPVLEQKEGES